MCAVLGTLSAPLAWAQADSRSLAEIGRRLQMGKKAAVTTASGEVVRGTLSTLSASSLELLVGGKLRTLAADDVKRVQQRQRDSLKNGVLIGAAAGAVYALSWFVRDPNECGGSPCGPEFVSSIGLGGLIGLGIDALIKRTVTIDNPGATRRSISPAAAVRPGSASVSVAVRW